MFKIAKCGIFIVFLATMHSLWANTTVEMYSMDSAKAKNNLGKITVTETPYGLLFSPQLKGLTPGVHGFHLHQHPSCGEQGMAAGSHYDPNTTDKHLGPYNDNGHLGDLPALYVNADGSVNMPVLAPRLRSLTEIKKHALMIHEGGDTYTDVPTLGGGGARMECGVVK
jgi:Cu-Zn family superoxide dismutase